MDKIVEKNKCCGCSSCSLKCPTNAISMIENREGFKYPVIEQSECCDCGLCKKICPALKELNNEKYLKCYVAYNRKLEQRLTSSSGGLFELFARYILSQNGIVVGSIIDSNNDVYHICIDNKNDLQKLKGSKYVQSDVRKVYIETKEHLKNGKVVLFTGTPCQISGLKAYLGKDYDNLYCQDIICHGTPSNKVLKKYISFINKENNSNINKVFFRNKDNGWKLFNMKLYDGDKVISNLNQHTDLFMKIFLSDICLRESCYNCNFKDKNKTSDITIGDFWGVEKYYPELDDNKGTSAVVVNTQKGLDLFNKIINKIEYKECQYDEILDGNISLIKSVHMPKTRNKFFEELDAFSIDVLASRNIPKIPITRRILRKVKVIIKKYIKE